MRGFRAFRSPIPRGRSRHPGAHRSRSPGRRRAPCRRELPGLLDAASRFDGVLSVCAVSVDEDAAAWRSAVEQEGLSPLLNLRLDRSDASFAELVARFDIRTIPHNLLLDGERRVVAVDLRGDALREWLEKELKR